MNIDGVDLSLDNLGQDLLQLVVGERWPNGDEGAMRALASVWTDAATELEQTAQQADSAAKSIESSYQGAAGDAFQSYWSANLDDGQTSWPAGATPAALPWAAQFCKSMAQALNDGANQLETTKDTIMGNIAILVATITPQIIAGFVDFGATDATAAAEVGAERLTMQAFLDGVKEFLLHVVEMALEQGLQQAELSFVIQAKEWAEGHTNGIDWKSVGMAGQQGAEGGALGAGFGFGLGKLGGKMFGDDFGTSVAGKLGTGVVSGQLTNLSTDLINNGKVSWSDLTNGSAAGIVGAFGKDPNSVHTDIPDITVEDTDVRPDTTTDDAQALEPETAPVSLSTTLAGLDTHYDANGSVIGSQTADDAATGSGAAAGVSDATRFDAPTSVAASVSDFSTAASDAGSTASPLSDVTGDSVQSQVRDQPQLQPESVQPQTELQTPARTVSEPESQPQTAFDSGSGSGTGTGSGLGSDSGSASDIRTDPTTTAPDSSQLAATPHTTEPVASDLGTTAPVASDDATQAGHTTDPTDPNRDAPAQDPAQMASALGNLGAGNGSGATGDTGGSSGAGRYGVSATSDPLRAEPVPVRIPSARSDMPFADAPRSDMPVGDAPLAEPTRTDTDGASQIQTGADSTGTEPLRTGPSAVQPTGTDATRPESNGDAAMPGPRADAPIAPEGAHDDPQPERTTEAWAPPESPARQTDSATGEPARVDPGFDKSGAVPSGDSHTPEAAAVPEHSIWRPPAADPEPVRPAVDPRVAEVDAQAVDKPGGLAAFSDPKMLEQAQRIPPDPGGAMDLDMHSDGSRMFVGVSSLDARGVYDLALARGLDPDQPIRLLGCGAGAEGNKLASELARISGHQVIAADTFVFSDDVGHVFATDGRVSPDGRLVPDIPPTGHWNEFGPDGTKTPVGDAGFPPGFEHEGFGNWRAPVGETYARSGDEPRLTPEDYTGRRSDFETVPEHKPVPPDEAWVPTPDGGMRSPDGKLAVSPEQYAEVRKVETSAAEVEQRVTPILHDLERQIPDSRLVRLESRLKSEPSLNDKFLRLSKKAGDLPPEEIAKGFTDSVRYTLCTPEDGYVESTRRGLQALYDAGYEPVGDTLKNTWGNDSYKGVNSLWRDPESGTVFEVQFHTPQSFWAKEDGTHDIYAEQRRIDTPPERQVELQEMQNAVFRAVPVPEGAADIHYPDARSLTETVDEVSKDASRVEPGDGTTPASFGAPGPDAAQPPTHSTTSPQHPDPGNAQVGGRHPSEPPLRPIIPRTADDVRPHDQPGGLGHSTAQDQADLEALVPRTKDGEYQQYPDPTSGYVDKQNDGGAMSSAFRRNNCVDNARSFLRTWFGRPTVADPRIAEHDSRGYPLLRGEANAVENVEDWAGVRMHSDGTVADGAYTALEERLKAAGHGSAAIVFVDWPVGANGEKSGHAFNVVNHEGTIYWVDGQLGLVSTDQIHTKAVGVYSVAFDPNRVPLDANAPSAEARPLNAPALDVSDSKAGLQSPQLPKAPEPSAGPAGGFGGQITDPALLQKNAEVKTALDEQLTPVNPDTSEVVSRLLGDDNKLNLTEALRSPETRDAMIATLREISGSRLLDNHSLADFLEVNPGRGSLFEPVTRAENYTDVGTKRVADYVEQIKPDDPIRDLGGDQAKRLYDYLDKQDKRFPLPDLSPEDSARLEALSEYSDRLKFQVMPTATRELQDIIDTLPPGADARINARAKPAKGLVDKVGRMSGGWQGRAPRPDYQVGDVIDAVGARITVGSAADLGRVLDMIKERFGTGDGGRVLEIENMYAQPKSNNPAYRVVPLVVSVEVDHVPYTYELQLTTRRASVAADMEHNSVYKNHVGASPEQQEAVKRAMQEAAAIEQLEASGE